MIDGEQFAVLPLPVVRVAMGLQWLDEQRLLLMLRVQRVERLVARLRRRRCHINSGLQRFELVDANERVGRRCQSLEVPNGYLILLQLPVFDAVRAAATLWAVLTFRGLLLVCLVIGR